MNSPKKASAGTTRTVEAIKAKALYEADLTAQAWQLIFDHMEAVMDPEDDRPDPDLNSPDKQTPP
ncbi:hypothetical protein V0U79_12105 [Hyphobacterium sp. HN65]|uniref:Uncharacterized protein n=1 Tax=Hyphobacterium lacteum TaxID=3116575 RepID=A0ABU7LT88_9PROT|nr:hypothetical protein [Hyphobacterium sp. HN65]MEE2527113.1 hypothetical protein [Hyphobacterium sp. HN65]